MLLFLKSGNIFVTIMTPKKKLPMLVIPPTRALKNNQLSLSINLAKALCLMRAL